MWKFSIQSIGKHINRGSLHSSHKHCFSIWKWRIFWMLEKFKLNCLYVLINFFFSFLFNSFVDFAIKLFVQNNNCFQTHKCFNQNFSHSENFFCLFKIFLGFKNFWKKIENFSTEVVNLEIKILRCGFRVLCFEDRVLIFWQNSRKKWKYVLYNMI